jgi:hypothetical protein
MFRLLPANTTKNPVAHIERKQTNSDSLLSHIACMMAGVRFKANVPCLACMLGM